jgi:prepilin-type N-terminal cleavage/methylation domain-containing protein
MSRATKQLGFTLVEVMIALAILSMGLVTLLVFTGNNVVQSHEVGRENIAVDLARGKMYDLEEQLVTDGFQQLEQTSDGDFSDEGWPSYEWSATISKIELPDIGALTSFGAAGAEGEGGAAGAGSSPLTGLLGMAGMGGGAGGGAGGALIASQFEIIRNVLEESIRKITLTVTWKVTGNKHELVLSYYVTDPAAVDRLVPGAGGSSGATSDSDSGSGGSSGGNAPKPSASGSNGFGSSGSRGGGSGSRGGLRGGGGN